MLPKSILDILAADHVVPIVTYLAHDSSTSTGGIYEVGGGWYSKVRFQRSAGVRLGSLDAVCAAEDIGQHFSKIEDYTHGEAEYPLGAEDAIRTIVDETKVGLHDASSSSSSSSSSAAVASDSAAANDSSSSTNSVLQSDKFFQNLQDVMKHDKHKNIAATIKEEMQEKILFEIYPSSLSDATSSAKHWLINFSDPSKSNEEAVQFIPNGHEVDFSLPEHKPKVTIKCSDSTLIKLIDGSLSPEYAYLWGDMKIRGKMDEAIKLKRLIALTRNI